MLGLEQKIASTVIDLWLGLGALTKYLSIASEIHIIEIISLW